MTPGFELADRGCLTDRLLPIIITNKSLRRVFISKQSFQNAAIAEGGKLKAVIP